MSLPRHLEWVLQYIHPVGLLRKVMYIHSRDFSIWVRYDCVLQSVFPRQKLILIDTFSQGGEINMDQAHRGYSIADDASGRLSGINPLFMKYVPTNGRFSGQNSYGYRYLFLCTILVQKDVILIRKMFIDLR